MPLKKKYRQEGQDDPGLLNPRNEHKGRSRKKSRDRSSDGKNRDYLNPRNQSKRRGRRDGPDPSWDGGDRNRLNLSSQLERGIKRGREENETEDDQELLPSPGKKLNLGDDPKVESTNEKSKPQLRRSNSLDREGLKLAITDRHSASTTLKKEAMKDFSVVAVFSREAFENFGKRWKAKMNSETLELATRGSRSGVDIDQVKKLLAQQSKTLLTPDFQAEVQALLKDKTNPHVIGIVEGSEELPSFSLKTKVGEQNVDVSYTRVNYTQGLNAKGSKDNKQSMSVYVRDDMKGVYSVSKEIVSNGSNKINSVGLSYATKDGTKYRTLLVHIPNENIGSKGKEDATHAAFANYAKKASPVVVTSYFGDTNFSSPMRKYSSPSMGGHLPDGGTLNPQSSSAQKETHFMQSVPLTDGKAGHSVLQPSTLNYVFVDPDSDKREATDHPSIMQYVAHNDELAGRATTGSLRLLDYA